MTVSGNTASSYFFTGYLFKNVDDYKTIAALANDWQTTADLGKEKADKLAVLQTALNEMGYAVGPCVAPLCEMEPKNLETLRTALKNYGLL